VTHEFSIGNAIVLITSIVGFIGVWYRNQFKIERLEEKHSEQHQEKEKEHREIHRQIDAFWRWKDDHVKEDTIKHENANREIGEIRGSLRVTNEQYGHILAVLNELKDRLTSLEKSRLN